MSHPRCRWRGLKAIRRIRPKRSYRMSDYFVECYARALSPIVPPSPRSLGTTHSTIGLFRVLHWGPRKADGCGLYRDMDDTYGAPASWQAPGGTPRGRQGGRRTSRSRTSGLRRPMTDLSCAACAGTVSRSATRKAGVHPRMPSSWPPSARPAAVPDHEDLLDAMRETIGGRGHGGTRSHTTSRRVPLSDTVSDPYARRGDGACACGGRCTAPPVPL